MGLNKNFLHPYSRKANYLDCVEGSYNKCSEPLDRLHKKKKKNRGKKKNQTTTPSLQDLLCLSILHISVSKDH